MISRRFVAREWLIFLGCLVIGIIWKYWLDYAGGWVGDQWLRTLNIESGKRMLTDAIYQPRAVLWVHIMALYLLVSVVRSIVWSLAAVFGKAGDK